MADDERRDPNVSEARLSFRACFGYVADGYRLPPDYRPLATLHVSQRLLPWSYTVSTLLAFPFTTCVCASNQDISIALST